MYRLKINLIPEERALVEKDLELSLDELGLSEVWIGPGVRVSYEISRIAGKFYGKFKAQGRARLECSRCLEAFEQDFSTQFVLQFEEAPTDPNPRSGVDPDAPELNVVFYRDDQLEIGEELRQELEVLVPFAPLCREECRGLCPVCGGNRNETPCDCGQEQRNNPFGDLKQLFKKKENGNA